jgi:cytosine/adenosine deaminase-related metal-dependent hydrolase
VINTPEHAEAGVQAHLDLGMRAVFGYGASMTQKLDEFAGEFKGASWGHARQLHDRHFSSSGRLTMALALQGPEFTTMEVTTRDVAAARDIGVPMALHVGIPMGPPPKQAVRALADASLLADDMSFAHCCNTTADEFDLMADAGGRGMSCPVVDAILGMGSSPTTLMRERGLEACFTADAVVASTGDLFEEARVGMMLDRYDNASRAFGEGRAVSEHGERIGSREVLRAITTAAAHRCWLEDEVGSLSVGKQADIVLLDARHTNLWPASDVLSTVVNCAHGGNVDTVLVGGEIVKRDGELVNVDLATVRDDVLRARDRLYAAAGYDDIYPV